MKEFSFERAAMQNDPTPVTEDEAREHLLEEIADVNVCLFYLVDDAVSYERIAKVQREKMQRWKARLEALQ
ncbi:MAG: hypothetical protein LUC47_07675 [Clostridiales bacterium]|nr:hypothetical protein [Clostridiales bacterium]